MLEDAWSCLPQVRALSAQESAGGAGLELGFDIDEGVLEGVADFFLLGDQASHLSSPSATGAAPQQVLALKRDSAQRSPEGTGTVQIVFMAP